MVTRIKILYEGDRSLRSALGEFLNEPRDKARSRKIEWEIVSCGSRGKAFQDFCDSIDDEPETYTILLVDSEAPVHHPPWEHLQRRKEVSWPRPQASDDQCQLMVQMMEAWFLADIPVLKTYFGQGFNENALPKEKNVERIDKEKIQTALRDATRNSIKKKYHKTQHAPEILRRLNVENVRKAAPHCDRLFKTLAELIEPPTQASDSETQPSGPNLP